jgi:hypothetical protein
VAAIALSGCLSPIAMHWAVIEDDRPVSYVQSDLLLLNIARAVSDFCKDCLSTPTQRYAGSH